MPDSFADSHIVGVGIDIVDVERISRMIAEYGDIFLKRTFTDAEIAYCNKFSDAPVHFAARFAAKEAMAKALSTGFANGITPLGLSVENDAQTAAPAAVLGGAARARMEELGAKKMSVSLTHLKDYAQALAILSR